MSKGLYIKKICIDFEEITVDMVRVIKNKEREIHFTTSWPCKIDSVGKLCDELIEFVENQFDSLGSLARLADLISYQSPLNN
jgi:hypothetical protein